MNRICVTDIWANLCQNQQVASAHNGGLDQPGHQLSLIRVLYVAKNPWYHVSWCTVITDLTGKMLTLIRVFAGHIYYFVLSEGGSFWGEQTFSDEQI